jgi:hypothetical protein
MVRSLPALALLAAAVAAPSASAQYVYSTPVVSRQPLFRSFAPAPSISNTPRMNAWQAGRLFNRPLFAGPASAHPISRPFWAGPNYDPDRVFGGSPFQSRPLLNIAIREALR